jgi:hypothetical protein
VEAGDYHNSVLLSLKEYSEGKAPDSRTPSSSVDNGKLQRVFCDSFNRGLDCQGETLTKLRAYVVIPSPSLLQILTGLWYPDDRERHGFLNRFALTCSQEMTSEGFCSWRAMR